MSEGHVGMLSNVETRILPLGKGGAPARTGKRIASSPPSVFTSFVERTLNVVRASIDPRRRDMKRLIGACVLIAAWTTGVLNSAHGQSNEARQLMQATNEDRAQHGLGPLKWDPALARAAQRHADLMVGQRALSNQYGGEADLETLVGQEGALFHVVAENLAAAATPAALEAEWIQSPGHRANIL